MLRSEFAALVRTYTGTDSTTFTDTEILTLANPIMEKQAMRIKDTNEDLFGGILTRDLVADTREYSLPSDMLSTIYRVEAKLDGTKWRDLDEVELPLLRDLATDEDSIRAYFANRKPAYDLYRRSLFIYSGEAVTDVTGGIKLWAFLWPSKMGNLTDTIDLSTPATDTSVGFPREFHELLAREVSITWKGTKDVPLPLSQHELKFEEDFKHALDSVRNANEDRAIGANEPFDNGFDY